MAVHVPPAMSPGLSAGIAEVAAMFDSTFHKRFRSSYDSSPSPTLPVRKRYRGTSELILDTDSEDDEEVEESLDSNSVSEDAEDEGPTAEDGDPATRDEGLAAGDEGLSIRVKVVPEGQQQAAPIMGTAVSAPLGLGYRALRHEELALKEDHVYSKFEVDPEDSMVYIDVPVYPPLAPPVQTPQSPKWSSDSFLIYPAPYIVPLPISSPMTSLTVPSPITSLVATPTTTIPVDEDQFIEVGAQLQLYWSILQDHTWRLDAMPPALSAKIDRDVIELYTRSRAAWAGRVDTWMTDMSRAGYDDHRLVYDMLLQQTAFHRELQEMRGPGTELEQEIDCIEQGANRKVIDREWSREILETVVMIELETDHTFIVSAFEEGEIPLRG
uniref:Uncharacterized protein n=1 Tax=Tanacetum cinerariifolium TaxID=118510 RepID=A0A699I1Z8_TANCI|nr:hypothetical protein [Tanacetum cinerariifolium]